MKKVYVRPTVSKIDYCYDEQVVAASEQIGQEQKHNDNYCHYKMSTGCASVVHQNTTMCDTNLWNLRRGG